MPVLSVSRKLRRATARFVHWWIEQSLPDGAANPPQISSCFEKRERILQPVFVTTTTSS